MKDEIHSMILDAVNDLRKKVDTLNTRLDMIERCLWDLDSIGPRLNLIERCLQDINTLAEKRVKDRERKRVAYREDKILRGENYSPRKKEKEKGKENFPPHPLIEKREEEEKTSPSSPRARVRDDLKTGGNPTFDQVEKYATIQGISAAFAKGWFDRMNRENEFRRWLHPKTGAPLMNWRSYLRICWKRRDEFDPYEPAVEEKKPFKSKAIADIINGRD